MSRKSWLFAILAFLLACCVITACAGAGILGARERLQGLLGGQAGGQASGAEQATAAVPPQRSTPAAGGNDERPSGGTLRLAGGLPPTLDPAMAQDSTSAEYIVHLFSGLVRLNGDLVVVPDLADHWTVSDDGRLYTFVLRENAQFADGRAITAADVIGSLERACSPELGSPVAASYLNDIVGVADYAQGRAASIAGLRAPTPDSVEITIDAPKAYFTAKLTYPAAFVVDRQQIEAEGQSWVQHPNGSGPFVLAELTAQRIVLERNARYYGPGPALDRVEYLVTGGYPVTMYENNELDIVEVPPSEMERLLDPENPLHDEVRMSSELSVTYLGLNVQQAPFDDPAVRQAFAMAIDKAKIADLVLQGGGTVAAGILPPGMPDFDPSLVGYRYDPEGARRLLAGSRYGQNGTMPPVVLAISGSSGYMDSVTEAVLSLVEDNLGIAITVHQVDWADFLRDMSARRYQMYLTGWIVDYPDSENFLDLLFHSASPQNHMGYSSAAVDQLLEHARLEQDPAQRTQEYREAERLIVADAPWIPLVHGLRVSLIKPNVQGFAATSAIYPWLQDVYLGQ
ncbi:MAG: peptide ABC transporter substrate-binding protein [Chloroflexi bacterium]|nr:peptide ABC transporter substrate-binding protein [Chloroflexota bacterium]